MWSVVDDSPVVVSVIVIVQLLPEPFVIEALMWSPGRTVIDGMTVAAAGRFSHHAV